MPIELIIIFGALFMLAGATAIPSLHALIVAAAQAYRARKQPAAPIASEEPPTPLAPEDILRVSYHEAAHAIVAAAFPKHKIPIRIEVYPEIRDGNLGMAVFKVGVALEGRMVIAKSDFLHDICIDIAGRAAELLIFHEASTGDISDLRSAGKSARGMVRTLGMSQMFAHRCFDDDEPMSEQISFMLDWEAHVIVVQCFAHATRILEKNTQLLHEMAQALRDQWVLEGEALAAFCGRVVPEEPPTAPDPKAN